MSDRIIRVTKCAECRYFHHDWPFYCRANNRMLPGYQEPIPDWCPLERVPGAKGASDDE